MNERERITNLGSDSLGGRLRMMQTMIDGFNAVDYRGELLSGNQLADLMGIERDEEGKVPLTPFINACMRVDEFEGIQKLPEQQRIQAMSTAFRMLDVLVYHQTP